MSYAIVYSSRTGNTELLARAIQSALPAEDCLYFGGPDAAALAADRLYVGFWTTRAAATRRWRLFSPLWSTRKCSCSAPPGSAASPPISRRC